MIGRAVLVAMSLTIASVNWPGVVDVPMSIVGRTRDTVVARLMIPPSARAARSRAMAGHRDVMALPTGTRVRRQSATPADGFA